MLPALECRLVGCRHHCQATVGTPCLSRSRGPRQWRHPSNVAVVRLLLDNDSSLTAARQGGIRPSIASPGNSSKIIAALEPPRMTRPSRASLVLSE